jgi:hypothetical protein
MNDDTGRRNRLDGLIQKFQLIRQFFASLRRRGAWRTIKISIFEIYYEYKLGVDTAYIIPTGRLDGDKDALIHATDYFPSSYLLLSEAFSLVGRACRDAVLVDYGSGMGRTLLFASTLPLRRLIGVEISQSLCTEATINLERLYKATKRTEPRWSIFNEDARLFEVPSEANLFYFFNPFDATILGRVADRIVNSARKAPRKCIVIYANPLHQSELLSRGFRKTFAQNQDFALFELPAQSIPEPPR